MTLVLKAWVGLHARIYLIVNTFHMFQSSLTSTIGIVAEVTTGANFKPHMCDLGRSVLWGILCWSVMPQGRSHVLFHWYAKISSSAGPPALLLERLAGQQCLLDLSLA